MMTAAARTGLVEWRARRRVQGLNGSWGVLALTAGAVAFAIAVVSFQLTAAGRAGQPVSAGMKGTLTSLPAAAEGVVSRTLGRDKPSYQVRTTASGMAATNKAQGLAARFTSQGVRIRAGTALVNLGLRAYGYGTDLRSVSQVAPRASGNRVTYQRGTVTEWYANGPLGLEQGFIVKSPPARMAGRPLTFAFRLTDTANPSLQQDGRSLSLGSGLSYQGLVARDATGRLLHARLLLRPGGLLIEVEAQGARYPLRIDPFFQAAKLTASDGAASDSFGDRVAVSGDTIVVGSRSSFPEAAYVFTKPASGWSSATETAKLTASDGTPSDSFGSSVAISGDTIVVGADTATVNGQQEDGAAYVFVKPSGGWVSATETAKLTASDGRAFDLFGWSVGVSGDTVVVMPKSFAAPPTSEVYVFVKPSGGWVSGTETAKLTASDGALLDGDEVAVSGDTVVAGASTADAGRGAAYVFVKPAGGWANGTETAKLTASDAPLNYTFGRAVAISGAAIVVGDPEDGGFVLGGPGAAYVFVKPIGGWVSGTETAKLTASDGVVLDGLGAAVGISGGTIVAGAPGAGPHIGDFSQGAAYAFVMPPAGWANGTETAKLVPADAQGNWFVGNGVAAYGDTIVVGAPGATVSTNPNQGASYVFVNDSTPPMTTIGLAPSSPNGSGGWYTSPVHATVSAVDNTGGSGLAETRCVLDPATPPASFDDLPAGCAYTGAGMDVTTDGTHTLYAASKDNVGNKESIESVSFKIDQTPPTVTCGTAPVFALGGPGGNVSATVTDAPSGPAASPVLAAVTSADTASAGPGTKSLTGFDNAGNQTTVNCPYTVGYQFLGFFSPLPRQNVNAGSTVSVKFALADNTGTRIPDAQAQAIAAACNARIFFTALTPSPNCFSYDTVGKQFVFNLRTPKGVTGLFTITAEVFSGATLVDTASTQINLR